MLLEQGKTKIYSLADVGSYKKADACFMLFPKLLCVDGSHETNNESRPLVSLSVKDSNGKVTVVVRYIAPNERSWFFRWLFQEVLPALLGEESLHSVKLIMTDGDSQEMSQVDFAVSTLLSPHICQRSTQSMWVAPCRDSKVYLRHFL